MLIRRGGPAEGSARRRAEGPRELECPAGKASGVTVVIPCFNEAARLDISALGGGIGRLGWRAVLVDDGSSDGTPDLLEGLRRSLPQAVSVLRLPSNVGKGEAVRMGMLAALDDDDDEFLAYLDADLSTPFRELARLVARLRQDAALDVVLGSRILRLGAEIRRSWMRHLVGRAYATGASLALGVGVYDTQCGAKAFRCTPRLVAALSEPFAERWSFDVELLSRLTRDGGSDAWSTIAEEPLLSWVDRPGSAMRPVASLRAGAELIRIGLRHRRGG